MSYLLDTCVLSELFKPRTEPTVVAWLDDADEAQLYISVLVLGEIQKGVARLADGERRRRIQQWLDTDLRERFDERVLAIDEQVALEWGRLTAARERTGDPLPVIEGLLAATAVCHGLELVTRNLSDFRALHVRLLDPWQTG